MSSLTKYRWERRWPSWERWPHIPGSGASNELPRTVIRYLLGGILGIVAAFLVLSLGVMSTADWKPAASGGTATEASSLSPNTELTALSQQRDALLRRLRSAIPSEPYIVVNTLENRLYLMAGTDTLRAALCSTGSFRRLEDSSGRKWHFKTPQGRFEVLAKQTNPLWIKPDWAFVEEGKPIPPPNSPLRAEAGVLGRYALGFGDGYLIHGTLYTRLIGLPVTHGCIRLGDEDLEFVYKASRVGTSVFLY